MFFSVVLQASTGKKLQENNHGNNYGTRKFDAKHSTTIKYGSSLLRHVPSICSFQKVLIRKVYKMGY